MWKTILDELKKTENENLIKTFISPLYPVKESREEIILCCRSSMAFDFLNKNGYLKKIKDLAQNLFNKNTKVEIVIKQDDDEEKLQTNIVFEDEKKEKPVEKIEEIDYFENNFRNYTFDNFVSGPSNITVYESAKKIAENPGSCYNPFFIYGDSGLGKTHIIKAIGNYLKDNKKKNIYYSTANQLISEYILSLKNKTMFEFRDNIVKNDVLLIDDIQFLSGKDATQIEFFNIFNDFYNRNKQIVITSDKYISEIPDIDTRLKTRFSMGVFADIKQPEYETREAIIKKKSELYGINISDEAVDLIASNIKNNIREIEGALKTLKISFDFFGKGIIDRNFAKNILKDLIKKDKIVGIDDIIKMVSLNTSIKPSDITSKKKTKQVSMSRQIAMYISRKYTSKTLKEIGESFGGRDHSTVKNAIDNMEKLICEDMNIKKLVEKIENEIERNNKN